MVPINKTKTIIDFSYVKNETLIVLSVYLVPELSHFIIFKMAEAAILDFVTTMIPNSTITIPVDFVMAEIVGIYTSFSLSGAI